MFDSLREQSGNEPSPQGQDALGADSSLDMSPAPATGAPPLLGLSPAQRLIIAVMLLLSVCVLGTLCLLVTGRIGLG